MTLTEIIGAFGLLLGVIASSAAAVAVFRAKVASARIDALRGDVEDRDKRIVFLEGENDRHAEETERTKAALERIGQENKRLWDRTQAVDLLTQHERNAVERYEAYRRQNGDVIILLRQLRDALKAFTPPRTEDRN